ncbi:CoA-transferase family III [Laetiporus sulphureus 93-53]|uniref:CoA-transferase family III n=1 Tax=Laetiporus sulphureus 93-53 TaxID=1314785 RepID=A0A165BQU9_9APHY|nr:CoA-transferase family III [Laetiporus sulphureus 93-53]KZT01487.1 CoA-transferase family III [Laetiporus sulphureus 93-53]
MILQNFNDTLRVNSASSQKSNELPLAGIRVLEIGQVIAGPFCGQLLGHFGAEVVKVEPPGVGDPLRVWRELDVDGVSPWWRSIGRNKKSVTIDLRKQEGRELVRKLAIKSDVLLENFKPGTLEKWILGPANLHPHNPSLIFTRVSGYGQTGPWSSRPGYASVTEAESRFRYVNGFPDLETGAMSGPPVRPNLSIGDSVAGLHAAFGTVLALFSRRAREAKGQHGGQTVDVSLLESMINLMEGVIPEYDRKGKIRGSSGSSITGIVSTNVFPCKPSPTNLHVPSYIVIGANANSMYVRLMSAIGRPDLTGPHYARNQHRVARQQVIEDAISAWTRERTAEEVEEVLQAVGVPTGRVLSIKELVENPQVQARGMLEDLPVRNPKTGEEWTVKVPKMVPFLEGCESKTRWAGPELGQHNHEVLVEELGLSEEQLNRLQADGVIGKC